MLKLKTTHYGTASLGEVIQMLERANPDADVQYDFCYLRPTDVDSYRGYYDHLALGWSDKHDDEGYWPKVSTLLERLRAAVGNTYYGYKGGEYRMNEDTPLWVANYSHSGGTGIVGMTIDEYTVVLHTDMVD